MTRRFHLWLYWPRCPLPLRCVSPATIAAGDKASGNRGNRANNEEEDMNSVHLIGRLATDVEVKEVNGGISSAVWPPTWRSRR